MPVCYPDAAGEPYRPSNGTEGMLFMERWCHRCTQDTEESPCEIITAALLFDLKDEGYPREEWVYDKDGRPSCTAFIHEDGEQAYRCPDTQDMFGDKP